MVDVTECVFLYAQRLQQSGNKGKGISNGKFYDRGNWEFGILRFGVLGTGMTQECSSKIDPKNHIPAVETVKE